MEATGEPTRATEPGPLDDLARLAAYVAGTSACFRAVDGSILGSAGLLDPDAYDLALAVADRQVVVPDTTLDRRLSAHALVVGAPYVRFWARLPVRDARGATIAWLDLADLVSRLLPDDRLDALAALTRQAAAAVAPPAPDTAWREALAQVPLPIFLLAVSGPDDAPEVRLEGGNDAARRITSDEVSARFGGDLEAIFPWAAPNRVVERCLRVHRSGKAEQFQLPLAIGRATRLTYSVRIFPLPAGHLGVAVEDVTDRADLQRRKDEFVTVVSHELRTPLSSIRGAVGLLEGGVAGTLPDNAARLVGIAREGAERMARMLSDLLDLERLRGGLLPLRAEPISVSELVRLATTATTGAARAAGVRIDCTVERDGSVLGDRERLAQALTNVLSNAVKFSPSGGDVQVRVSRPDGSRVRVEVEDAGRGLRPEDAERIFTPFQPADVPDTRARGGLGLGLAISRFIVEGHGGVIGVLGGREQGATFWVELPVLANPVG